MILEPWWPLDFVSGVAYPLKHPTIVRVFTTDAGTTYFYAKRRAKPAAPWAPDFVAMRILDNGDPIAIRCALIELALKPPKVPAYPGSKPDE